MLPQCTLETNPCSTAVSCATGPGGRQGGIATPTHLVTSAGYGLAQVYWGGLDSARMVENGVLSLLSESANPTFPGEGWMTTEQQQLESDLQSGLSDSLQPGESQIPTHGHLGSLCPQLQPSFHEPGQAPPRLHFFSFI